MDLCNIPKLRCHSTCELFILIDFSYFLQNLSYPTHNLFESGAQHTHRKLLFPVANSKKKQVIASFCPLPRSHGWFITHELTLCAVTFGLALLSPKLALVPQYQPYRPPDLRCRATPHFHLHVTHYQGTRANHPRLNRLIH